MFLLLHYPIFALNPVELKIVMVLRGDDVIFHRVVVVVAVLEEFEVGFRVGADSNEEKGEEEGEEGGGREHDVDL